MKRLGIDQTFYCPKIKDYTIGGQYTSPNYRYLYIKVMKCDSTKRADCKSEADIDTWIDQAQVSLYYNNFYFDSDDYVNPVKKYIDDKLWFSIMPAIRKDADVFVRQNTYSLQDGYFQIGGEDTGTFMSVSGQRETIDDYEIGDQKMIRVYFRIDPILTEYNRQVYSSGDLLAQVGGVFSFLQGIGAVLVFIFSERLLVAALAGKLYQVYDEKHYHNDNGYDHMEFDPMNDTVRTANLRHINSKVQVMESAEDEENQFYQDNPIRKLFMNTLYCK